MVVIDEPQAINGMSPGQMLVAGRERAGLTQEQVAKNLYMTVYKVNALEKDDYSRLNSETFTRGYIRAYANLVKVNIEEVLLAYDNLLGQIAPEPDSVQTVVSTTQSTPKVAWMFLLTVALFFLVLWLISVWFFDNHGESTYTVAPASITKTNTTSAQSSSLPVAPNQSVLARVAVTDNTQTTSSLSGTDGNLNASTSSVSSLVSSVSREVSSTTSSVTKAATLDEISFVFKSESWLEVSDARGDVLATELQPQGSKVRLLGRAPFDVKLGNAPGVDVLLNGKKVEVIPLMGSNVLILKVGN